MILYKGDCIEEMQKIPDGSISLILTDLPYETTHNEWDKKIPFDKLWDEWLRILKPNGVIALWSQMPFTAEVIMSNPELFRYEWIIEKTRGTGFLNAKKMPMKAHENVLIFYKSLPIYNPQKTTGHTPVHSFHKHTDDGVVMEKQKQKDLAEEVPKDFQEMYLPLNGILKKVNFILRKNLLQRMSIL